MAKGEPKPYCEGCTKKATIHLTEIIDGELTEMHLCEDCPLLKNLQMESEFGLADLLAGLADFGKQLKPKETTTIKCKACGMTYDDFRRTGRFGCSRCYDVFGKPLASLLKKIHGSNQHIGKSPITLPTSQKKKIEGLQGLKRQLTEAIQKEDYEQAARLRDKIHSLEKKKK